KSPAPFIEVRHFEVSGGLIEVLRRHRRFTNVTLDGLRITIPPRTPRDHESGTTAAPTVAGTIVVEHVGARDAQLVFQPRNPRKEPKVYLIHSLELDSVGFNREIPFTATLTNAVPKGEIATKGAFGPWVKGDPGSTPLRGRYSFARADLDTIPGLGGT